MDYGENGLLKISEREFFKKEAQIANSGNRNSSP